MAKLTSSIKLEVRNVYFNATREDRTMDIGNMQKFGEDRTCSPSFGYMLKMPAQIFKFPGMDFRFPSTSVPVGT